MSCLPSTVHVVASGDNPVASWCVIKTVQLSKKLRVVASRVNRVLHMRMD